MIFHKKVFFSVTVWMLSEIGHLSANCWAIEGIDRRFACIKRHRDHVVVRTWELEQFQWYCRQGFHIEQLAICTPWLLVNRFAILKVKEYNFKNSKLLDAPTCQNRWRWTLFYFSFFIFILLYFSFSFNFLFLEQLGLGVISHAVTSVTTWWCSHETDHGRSRRN